MNSLLQEAIAGEPITVKLGGQSYPLAYPMLAVILYKRETALLDRERTKDRPRLSLEEKRSLRTRRQKLITDANLLRPGKGQDWQPDKFVEFDLLMDEASALKTALDEDAGTGDSLYDMYNWRKISPDADPERLVLALWVGLHRFDNENGKIIYREGVRRDRLGELIDLGNGGDIMMAISKALSAHLIAQSETAALEEVVETADDGRGDFDLPNPQPPASPAATTERTQDRAVGAPRDWRPRRPQQ